MTFQQACYSYEIRKGLLCSCPVTLNPEGFSQVSCKIHAGRAAGHRTYADGSV